MEHPAVLGPHELQKHRRGLGQQAISLKRLTLSGIGKHPQRLKLLTLPLTTFEMLAWPTRTNLRTR